MNIEQREFAPLLETFTHGIVAIDLETTGLSPLVDRIIELAAVKISPDPSCPLETWEHLINPEIPIPQITTDIHGITDANVFYKPPLRDLLPSFKEFIGDLPIVAHNAKFDAGFLVFAQHQLKMKLGKNQVYCSVKASRQAFPEMPNHRLSTLSEELEVTLDNHHRAMDDAIACLSIFSKAVASPRREKVLKESNIFRLNDFNKNQFPPLPKHLEVLAKKVEKQTLVDIKYKGGSHKGKFRPVKPISLLPMPEGNILYGLCLLSNLHKSFALSKIQEVKELNAEEISQRFKELEKRKKEL